MEQLFAVRVLVHYHDKSNVDHAAVRRLLSAAAVDSLHLLLADGTSVALASYIQTKAADRKSIVDVLESSGSSLIQVAAVFMLAEARAAADALPSSPHELEAACSALERLLGCLATKRPLLPVRDIKQSARVKFGTAARRRAAHRASRPGADASDPEVSILRAVNAILRLCDVATHCLAVVSRQSVSSKSSCETAVALSTRLLTLAASLYEVQKADPNPALSFFSSNSLRTALVAGAMHLGAIAIEHLEIEPMTWIHVANRIVMSCSTSVKPRTSVLSALFGGMIKAGRRYESAERNSKVAEGAVCLLSTLHVVLETDTVRDSQTRHEDHSHVSGTSSETRAGLPSAEASATLTLSNGAISQAARSFLGERVVAAEEDGDEGRIAARTVYQACEEYAARAGESDGMMGFLARLFAAAGRQCRLESSDDSVVSVSEGTLTCQPDESDASSDGAHTRPESPPFAVDVFDQRSKDGFGASATVGSSSEAGAEHAERADLHREIGALALDTLAHWISRAQNFRRYSELHLETFTVDICRSASYFSLNNSSASYDLRAAMTDFGSLIGPTLFHEMAGVSSTSGKTKWGPLIATLVNTCDRMNPVLQSIINSGKDSVVVTTVLDAFLQKREPTEPAGEPSTDAPYGLPSESLLQILISLISRENGLEIITVLVTRLKQCVGEDGTENSISHNASIMVLLSHAILVLLGQGGTTNEARISFASLYNRDAGNILDPTFPSYFPELQRMEAKPISSPNAELARVLLPVLRDLPEVIDALCSQASGQVWEQLSSLAAKPPEAAAPLSNPEGANRRQEKIRYHTFWASAMLQEALVTVTTMSEHSFETLFPPSDLSTNMGYSSPFVCMKSLKSSSLRDRIKSFLVKRKQPSFTLLYTAECFTLLFAQTRTWSENRIHIPSQDLCILLNSLVSNVISIAGDCVHNDVSDNFECLQKKFRSDAEFETNHVRGDGEDARSQFYSRIRREHVGLACLHLAMSYSRDIGTNQSSRLLASVMNTATKLLSYLTFEQISQSRDLLFQVAKLLLFLPNAFDVLSRSLSNFFVRYVKKEFPTLGEDLNSVRELLKFTARVCGLRKLSELGSLSSKGMHLFCRFAGDVATDSAYDTTSVSMSLSTGTVPDIFGSKVSNWLSTKMPSVRLKSILAMLLVPSDESAVAVSTHAQSLSALTMACTGSKSWSNAILRAIQECVLDKEDNFAIRMVRRSVMNSATMSESVLSLFEKLVDSSDSTLASEVLHAVFLASCHLFENEEDGSFENRVRLLRFAVCLAISYGGISRPNDTNLPSSLLVPTLVNVVFSSLERLTQRTAALMDFKARKQSLLLLCNLIDCFFAGIYPDRPSYFTREIEALHAREVLSTPPGISQNDGNDKSDDNDRVVASESDSDVKGGGDEALKSSLCTYTTTGSQFVEQHWYFCYSCELAGSEGVCSVCARTCHQGCELAYSKFSRFFCDCGAGSDPQQDSSLNPMSTSDDGDGATGGANDSALQNLPSSQARKRKPCKCLKPTRPKQGSVQPSQCGPDPKAEPIPLDHDRDMFPDERLREQLVAEIRMAYEGDARDSDCLSEVQQELIGILKSPEAVGALTRTALLLVKDLDCSTSVNQTSDDLILPIRSTFEELPSLQSDRSFGITPKTENLAQCARVLKSGALEVAKSTVHDKMRASRVSLLSFSPTGNVVAVAQQTGIVEFIDASDMIGLVEAPVEKRFANGFCRVSVSFSIVGVRFHPENSNLLLVMGVEKICILSREDGNGNCRWEQLEIELGLTEFDGYDGYNALLDVSWIDGGPALVLVTTAKFVKIFDAAVDTYCPQFYATLPVYATGPTASIPPNSGGEKEASVALTGSCIAGSVAVPFGHGTTVKAFHVFVVTRDSHLHVAFSGRQTADSRLSLLCKVFDGAVESMSRVVGIWFHPAESLLLLAFESGSVLCISIYQSPEGEEDPAVRWAQLYKDAISSGLDTIVSPVYGEDAVFMFSRVGDTLQAGGVLRVTPDRLMNVHSFSRSSSASVAGIASFASSRYLGEPACGGGFVMLDDGSLYRMNFLDRSARLQVSRDSVLSRIIERRSRRELQSGGSNNDLHHGYSAVPDPVGFFEKCRLVADQMLIEGVDEAEMEESKFERMGVTLAGGSGDCVVSSKENEPFKFVARVENRSIVLVGARLRFGGTDRSRNLVPSEVKVFGRTVKWRSRNGVKRWLDVPFSVPESMESPQKVNFELVPRHTVGDSSTIGEGLLAIDTLELYAVSNIEFTERKLHYENEKGRHFERLNKRKESAERENKFRNHFKVNKDRTIGQGYSFSLEQAGLLTVLRAIDSRSFASHKESDALLLEVNNLWSALFEGSRSRNAAFLYHLLAPCLQLCSDEPVGENGLDFSPKAKDLLTNGAKALGEKLAATGVLLRIDNVERALFAIGGLCRSFLMAGLSLPDESIEEWAKTFNASVSDSHTMRLVLQTHLSLGAGRFLYKSLHSACVNFVDIALVQDIYLRLSKPSRSSGTADQSFIRYLVQMMCSMNQTLRIFTAQRVLELFDSPATAAEVAGSPFESLVANALLRSFQSQRSVADLGASSPETVDGNDDADSAQRWAYRCDSCGEVCEQEWWHCKDCEDFDLCTSCLRQGDLSPGGPHKAHHLLLRGTAHDDISDHELSDDEGRRVSRFLKSTQESLIPLLDQFLGHVKEERDFRRSWRFLDAAETLVQLVGHKSPPELRKPRLEALFDSSFPSVLVEQNDIVVKELEDLATCEQLSRLSSRNAESLFIMLRILIHAKGSTTAALVHSIGIPAALCGLLQAMHPTLQMLTRGIASGYAICRSATTGDHLMSWSAWNSPVTGLHYDILAQKPYSQNCKESGTILRIVDELGYVESVFLNLLIATLEILEYSYKSAYSQAISMQMQDIPRNVLCDIINFCESIHPYLQELTLFKEVSSSATKLLSVLSYDDLNALHETLDKYLYAEQCARLGTIVNGDVGKDSSSLEYDSAVEIAGVVGSLHKAAVRHPATWRSFVIDHERVLNDLFAAIRRWDGQIRVNALQLLGAGVSLSADLASRVLKGIAVVDFEQARSTDSAVLSGVQESEEVLAPSEEVKGLLSPPALVQSGKNFSQVGLQIFEEGDFAILHFLVQQVMLRSQSLSARRASSQILMMGIARAAGRSEGEAFALALHDALMNGFKLMPFAGDLADGMVDCINFFILSCQSELFGTGSESLLSSLAVSISSLLKGRCSLLISHPNARLYGRLGCILEMSGYFLESDPCMTCSASICESSEQKDYRLDSIRAETKYTDSSIMHRLLSVHEVQAISVKVVDPRRSRRAKTIDVLYSSRSVTDAAELKSSDHPWHKLRSLELSSSATEARVDLVVPVAAANVKLEFVEFHTFSGSNSGRNGRQSDRALYSATSGSGRRSNAANGVSDNLQCPRCSRSVADRHGICRNCHENAYQCRQCRNINYENLDGFLCNECGYCKHGRFEFSISGRTTFVAERIVSEEDRRRASKVIEKETGNVHRCMEQLTRLRSSIIRSLNADLPAEDAKERPKLFGASRMGLADLLDSVAPRSDIAVLEALLEGQASHEIEEVANSTHGGISVTEEVVAESSGSADPSEREQNNPANSSLASPVNRGRNEARVPQADPAIINKTTTTLASTYSKECRSIYSSMSRGIRVLTLTRTELVRYANTVGGSRLEYAKDIGIEDGQSSPLSYSTAPVFEESSNEKPVGPRRACCYGCTQSFVSKCVQLLQTIMKWNSPAASTIQNSDLAKDMILVCSLCEKKSVRDDIRDLISDLVNENLHSTELVCTELARKIEFCIDSFETIDAHSVARFEMGILEAISTLDDSCWEERLRLVIRILFKSSNNALTCSSVAESIILPCLRVALRLMRTDSDLNVVENSSAADAGGSTEIASQEALQLQPSENSETENDDLDQPAQPAQIGNSPRAIDSEESESRIGEEQLRRTDPADDETNVPAVVARAPTGATSGSASDGRGITPRDQARADERRHVELILGSGAPSSVGTAFDGHLSDDDGNPQSQQSEAGIDISTITALLENDHDSKLLTADVGQWLEGKINQSTWIADMKLRFARYEQKERIGGQTEGLHSADLSRTVFENWRRLCQSHETRNKTDPNLREAEFMPLKPLSIEEDNWIVRLMLFTPCATVRKEACALLELTCGQEESLQLQLLDVLTGPALSLGADVGEKSKEFFDLLEVTLSSQDHCLYLIATGFLPKLATIIRERAERLFLAEASAASSLELVNLLEGYSLKRLLSLLRQTLEAIPSQRMSMRQRLFEVDNNKLVWSLERAYICVRKLISLRTKLTDECGSQLCEVLMSREFLFTGPIVTAVISACVAELRAAKERNDAQAIAILLEQLCQMLCPERKDPVCYLALNKAPTQEEFIRGSMSRNPYPSSAFDGPLMRDVKNKICKDLDLPGLLEDDFGMELLVAGNLVKLDLPIMSVYDHVWRGSAAASMASTMQPTQVTRTFGLRRAPHSHSRVSGSGSRAGAMRSTILTFRRIATDRDSSEEEMRVDSRADPPMIVVYRLSGLDGEATEPIVDSVPAEADEEQDAEELYGDTIVFGEVGGLDVLFELLSILGSWGDDAETAVRAPALRLLRASCEVARNRALLAKSVNAVRTLLDCAASAFEYAQGSPTAVTSAESLLIAAEQILAQQRKELEISSKAMSDTVSLSSHDPEEVISRVRVFLGRLSVATSPKAENSILHLLPFLIQGVPMAIDVVLEHFHFSWDAIDSHEEEQRRARQLGTVLLATPNDLRGDTFAEQIIRKEVGENAVEYLIKKFPMPRSDHRAVWDSALNSPGPPLILRLLTGLSLFLVIRQGHQRSSALLRDILRKHAQIIQVLCQLEMAVSDNSVGTTAEELLEALSQDDSTKHEIEEERESIKKLRRDAAKASRLAILRETGLSGAHLEVQPQQAPHQIAQQTPVDKGPDRDSSELSTVLQLMEDLPDEVGPACVVCGDGFRCRPEDALAFYVYCRKVPLELSTGFSTAGAKSSTEGTSSSLQTSARVELELWSSGRNRNSGTLPPRSGANSCYTTVTHLNAIHLSCHKEAARVDRTSRRDEWDGASLRNSQTRCNNLFPVRPPIVLREHRQPNEESTLKSANISYSSAVDSYFGRLSSLGRTSLSHAKVITYDLGRSFLRFADGGTAVFSEHAKGGGPHSNACLIPHLVQLAIYLVEAAPQKADTKNTFTWNSSLQTQEAALIKFLEEDEIGDITYYLASALVLQSLSQWRLSLISFLRRGLRERILTRPLLFRLIAFCDLINCEMKRGVHIKEDGNWLDALRRHIGSDETFAQVFGDCVSERWEEYIRCAADEKTMMHALHRNSELTGVTTASQVDESWYDSVRSCATTQGDW